ncbi:hypothetical protein CPTAKMNP4_011 [Salmonella phage vB_SenM-AKM_NP4]|uniref:Uncharacterized protein n=1 Tax=Salmonella phage S16 TaxID=1087482 RepID=M1EAL0_BPS16|nr:hypothetical protein I133_gp260 [Salmonella phage vB_SenM-S16]AEO97007.1 hypothetical protein [Salmonella phage vB_SenM-S16]WDR21677.1 hypothetical protein PJM34_0009 [Salmonella phage vB_SenM_UTK0003]WLI71636.1 hypothetical protein CPTAKMNP4_011 [Salmonella phage vB_SenM-AKM_NP4]
MIFGKSSIQKNAARKLRLVERAIGKYKFALFPTKLDNGRYILLQKYYKVVQEFIVIEENNYAAYYDDRYSQTLTFSYESEEQAIHTIFCKKPNSSLCSPIYGAPALHHLMKYRDELIAKLN